jgi:hypothetical protein
MAGRQTMNGRLGCSSVHFPRAQLAPRFWCGHPGRPFGGVAGGELYPRTMYERYGIILVMIHYALCTMHIVAKTVEAIDEPQELEDT